MNDKQITSLEAERKARLSEAAQLMARLALILEKSRPLDQFLYRLRRKRCMKIVWTRRGRNEDTIISDMLKWLRIRPKGSTPRLLTRKEIDLATTHIP